MVDLPCLQPFKTYEFRVNVSFSLENFQSAADVWEFFAGVLKGNTIRDNPQL